MDMEVEDGFFVTPSMEGGLCHRRGRRGHVARRRCWWKEEEEVAVAPPFDFDFS